MQPGNAPRADQIFSEVDNLFMFLTEKTASAVNFAKYTLMEGVVNTRRVDNMMIPTEFDATNPAANDAEDRIALSEGLRRKKNVVKIAAVVALLGMGGATVADDAEAQTVDLGTAGDFGVLAGTTVTNTGDTVINGGSVGVSPGTAITGFPPGIVTPPGTIESATAVAGTAQSDLTDAFNDVAGLAPDDNLTGQDLGGQTLTAGVYKFDTSAQLTGVLTLDGQGVSSSEFFFQIGSTLTTASNSAVLLINEADGSNVYWQVGSSATLGTGTAFAGNILAGDSITLTTGATITCGSALAQNGAVTLDSNTITICVEGADNGDDTDISTAELGGEGATGTEHTAIDASTLFGSVLMGQGTFWRDGVGSGINGMTPESVRRDRSMKDAPGRSLKDGGLYAEDDGLGYYQPRTWRMWATGFGGAASLDGDQSTGSSGVDTRTWGFAAGFDYQIDPSALVGIAAGYTRSTFDVDELTTSGTAEGAHFGLYGVKTLGALYLAGTAQYARFHNDADRFIDWVIDEQASGDFDSDLFSAELEAGLRQHYDGVNVTPFLGLNVAFLNSDGYVEDSVQTDGAPGILGLTYESRSTTSLTSSLGVQLDTTISLDGGETVTPFARIAWVHEFNPDRDVDSFLTASPGAAFSLDGTSAATDTARMNAGFKVEMDGGVALFAAFEGEFSGESRDYAGSGGLKFSW